MKSEKRSKNSCVALTTFVSATGVAGQHSTEASRAPDAQERLRRNEWRTIDVLAQLFYLNRDEWRNHIADLAASLSNHGFSPAPVVSVALTAHRWGCLGVAGNQ